MPAQPCTDRQIIAVTGADALHFLHGLVTNDVAEDGLRYAALLTPQGKYLADFFLLRDADAILIDVAEGLAPGLMQRLSMYKLRADVALAPVDVPVWRGLGAPPEGAHADPRHQALGWRHYGALDATAEEIDWDALRVAHCIPESGIELVPNDSYILEMGFEHLGGVDFQKGCYVGQEVTARMKHKTALRKGLALVRVEGPATPGTEITANGKPVGTLHTRSGDRAIAYLRFDRAKAEMQAGAATVALI